MFLPQQSLLFLGLKTRLLPVALVAFVVGLPCGWVVGYWQGRSQVQSAMEGKSHSHPPARTRAAAETVAGLPKEPTGFITGVGETTEDMRANHVVPICALVTIPEGATKHVKFGFIHLADPGTIYPLGETAKTPGRQTFVACTSRASYSARSELILFSYKREGEAMLQRAIETGFVKSGVAIASIPGYEVLAIDGPDILNLKAK